MLASIAVYGGVVLAATGAFMRSPLACVVGLALAILALVFPAAPIRATGTSLLDDVLPVFEFHERHSLRIRASGAAVMEATRTVSADEIPLLRGLMWLRSLGRSRLLGPRGSQPVLEAMQRGGFLRLAENESEIVFGAAGRFWSTGVVAVATPADFSTFSQGGYGKAATNFRLLDDGNGWSRLTTETRIHGTDAAGRQRFAVYWRLIYPGSALIRRMWLRAIARRCRARLRP